MADQRAAASHALPAPAAATRLRPVGLDSSPLHGELLGVEQPRGARPGARRRLHAGARSAARPTRPAAPARRRRARAASRVSHCSPATCGAARHWGPPPSGCSTTSTSSRARSARSATTCRRATTSSCPSSRPASWPGTARVYAMAVELLRYSDARLDLQRLDAVHERLPDRGAAQDRRAVGVAQHAQARADRAPAPALGRAAREPGGAHRGGPLLRRLRAGARARARSPPLPQVLHVAFVDQLLQRMREYGARRPPSCESSSRSG